MKHILPLTYEPKIFDVRNGICTQTIRPCSDKKPKFVGDLVMYHGWEGRPYHSKWSFRTPYWKIKEIIWILITEDGIIMYDDPMRLLSPDECKDIAIKDGFVNYEEMYAEFVKMYGKKLETLVFEIIRWDYP